MACVEACRSAEAYHGIHKSAVEEMHNTAHCMVNKHCHQQGAVTGGCINYNGVKPNTIKFLNKHDLSGKNKETHPPKRHSGTFVHSADCGGHSD